MKTILLLFTGLLLSMNIVKAENPNKKDKHLDIPKRSRSAEPIKFVERDVEFYIFPNGSFDFNTPYMVKSRRNTANVTHYGSRANMNFNSNRVVKAYISNNRNGTIRSINNVFVNYDRFGKVTRIGNVLMDYENGKNGNLKSVGNLRVNYNRWGEIISIHGFVNQENRFLTYNEIRHNDYVNDYDRFDNDDNYYYFKQKRTVKKQKKR